MIRRALLLYVFGARLLSAAADGDRAVEIALANALNAGDAKAAVKLFDPKMPGYAHLRDNLEHLVAAAELVLDIDTETGIWNLDIAARDLATGVTHRKAKVSIRVQDALIETFQPLDFLAPPHGREAWDTLVAFADALQNQEAAPRMDQFDAAAPGFQDLKNSVIALWTRYQIEPSLDLKSNEGDDLHRTLQIDWTLTLNDPTDPVDAQQHEDTVVCRVDKQGSAWRIVSLAPATFFALPKK